MVDTTSFVQNTLLRLLEQKKYHSLRDILDTMNPSDLAALLNELDEKRLPLVFRLLSKELAAEAFVEMDPEQQELLIRGFSDTELREVLDELFVDDAVDIVEEMPANVVKRILAQADPDMRKEINEILRYPEDSTGCPGCQPSLRPPHPLVRTMAEQPAAAAVRTGCTTAATPLPS